MSTLGLDELRGTLQRLPIDDRVDFREMATWRGDDSEQFDAQRIQASCECSASCCSSGMCTAPPGE